VEPRFVLAALAVAALLAPGAWFVFRLPPVPIAKALQLATVAVWLFAVTFGLVRIARIERFVELALAGTLAVVALSWLTHGSLFAAAFYDLYGNMPLVQWLAFPTLFLLAGGVEESRADVERALGALVLIGGGFGVVIVYQFLTTAPLVFGSTGYSITALAPLVPVGVVLGLEARGRRRATMLAASGTLLIALGAFSGALMGTLTAVATLLLTVAVVPATLSAGRAWSVVRRVAAGLVALAFAALLFVQVPGLSAGFVSPAALDSAGAGLSVVSRAHMWQGAQRMVSERPILGFGPSGYRMVAVEYLEPEALQFEPDRAGDIDPVVYSPQSPHSLLWEIATRLGLLGVVAFLFLFVAWARALYRAVREEKASAPLRLALGAGFMAAVFSLQVNPVLFPMGLGVPLIAGLAIAPWGPNRRRQVDAGIHYGHGARIVFGVIGVAVLCIALWLGMGEWRAATAASDDTFALRAIHERTLEVVPGQPTIERRLAEVNLLLAADDEAAALAQASVDELPEYVLDYAPNGVSLVAYSLAQAERTGRTDLSWEAARLDEAAAVLPPIGSLVAERLHLAVLSGDAGEVVAALPDARAWGTFYPLTQGYIEQAEAMLAGAR
jgi:O-antigen ligase